MSYQQTNDDLLYIEDGYLTPDGYYVYIALAKVAIGPYIDEGYIEAGYYEDYSAQSGLVCDFDVISGVTVEATGTWTSEFAQSVTVTRIQDAVSNQSSQFAQTALIGKILEATAAFTDAFTPTLIADAFKNHTAVLDTVTTMTTDAAVNRSANVLLEHIADLNAMAAKTAVIDSNLSTTASVTTTPVKSVEATASFAVSATVTADGFDVKFAECQITARSSIFTSRNFGTGRPKNLRNVSYSSSIKRYGTHSLSSGLAADQTGTPKYISSRPHISDDWVFEAYFYVSTAPASNSFSFISDDWVSIGINARGGIQSANFSILKANPSNPINSAITERSFEQNNLITIGSWNHLLLVKNSNNLSFYVNGTRRYHSSSPPTEEYSRLNAATGTGSGLQALASTNTFIDEVSIHKQTTLGYDPSQSSITVPTQPRVNNEYTQFLFHFDGNSNDDVSGLLQSTSATVSSTVTVTAQATPNTKSVSASLTAVTIQTVSATKAVEATVTLTSTVDLVSDFDKFRPFSSDLSATVTVQDGLTRIRFAESTQNALFSPTVTVQATKTGDILLQSVFTAIIDANSFTEVPATLASEFNISADIDGIAKITSASLFADTAASAVIGTRESASVNITGAFNALVNVQYFEGTSLIAPMTATMAVTAQKTARITRTLQSAVTVSADVRENTQAPRANPIYTTFQERVEVDVTYNYTYNRISGTNRRTFSFRTNDAVPGGTVGLGAIRASSLFPDGSLAINNATGSVTFIVYIYGQSGSGDWYDVYDYSFNLGVVDSVNTGAATFVNGTGRIRIVLDVATTNFLQVYLDGSSTPLTLSAPSTVFRSRIFWPSFEPFAISNVNGRFGWPQVLFPSANTIIDQNSFGDITASSVSDLAYIPYYGPQEYAVADLVTDFASLSASAITVVFLQAGLLAGTFAQTTSGNRIRFGTSTLTAQSTIFANAGLQAVANASVTVSSTVQVSLNRVRSADLAAASTTILACEPTRVRLQSADINTQATLTAQAVKQTGNVIALETTVTQTTQGQRIRYADSEFSAFNSTVTVAAKNATGTVTLESAFAQITEAEKNAVAVITVEANFTQSTNTADGKIVGFSSDQNSEFTQETIGDRIQPAGSDMVSEFQQSAITNNSKITGITADVTSTVTVTAAAERFRDTISLQASLGTLVCQNDTIRFGQAAVTDEFSILASPTFIVRITADFIAFNSQLTVGEVINIDPFLQLKIPAETRGLFILPENRVITIESETRVNTIKE